MTNYVNNLNSLNNSCISNSSSTVSTTGSNSFMLNNNNVNNKMFTRRLSTDIVNHFVINNHHELTSENISNILIKNQQIDFSNINNPPSQGNYFIYLGWI